MFFRVLIQILIIVQSSVTRKVCKAFSFTLDTFTCFVITLKLILIKTFINTLNKKVILITIIMQNIFLEEHQVAFLS